MSKENEIIAFIDNVGRVIVGRLGKDTKTTMNVINPAVVNINVQEHTNQIAVQLLPFFFREFISAESKDKGVTWTFDKNSIVTSPDLELEDNIKTQYKSIFEDAPAPPAAEPVEGELAPATAGSEPEVVKLFDE